VCQNQQLTDKLNTTLLLELNSLRRYYATDSPVPDTLDDIASRILQVLRATATVDEQAQGIDFLVWNQRSHVAQKISYYRFVCFHRQSNKTNLFSDAHVCYIINGISFLDSHFQTSFSACFYVSKFFNTLFDLS